MCQLALPGNDFWLFDDHTVLWNHFTGDGASAGGEVTENPTAAKLCAEAFETVWALATPHNRDVPVDDSAAAASAHVERSCIIHQPGHRFVFVVEEDALRHQICGAEEMAAQLGYLLTAGALPQVSLGIIPMAVHARSQWPRETFHVYDDKLVSVELVSARVRITQPTEIALYLRAFEQLRGDAVYGADARALIAQAIDALS